MRINLKTNETKAAQAIDDGQKRASARLASLVDLAEAIKAAEGRLADLGIPKAMWKGAQARYAKCNTFPGAYKGRPECTVLVAERGAIFWFLVSVKRGDANSSSVNRYTMRMTEEQHAEAVRRLSRTQCL